MFDIFTGIYHLSRDKPTRDHCVATLKAQKKVFITSRRLPGELAQIMQP